MKRKLLIISLLLVWGASAFATGRLTCDSGDRSTWRSVEELKKQMLEKEGWEKIRKVKIDGECYEVYGTNPDGKKVEAYYHPVTLEKLLVARWFKILYDKREEDKKNKNQ